MQPTCRAALLLVCFVCSSNASVSDADSSQSASVTPIQKVLELLNGMLTKGKEEKQDETVRFAAFQTWCEQTSAEKEKMIKDGEDAITQLDADIAKAEADAEQLGEDIKALDAEINAAELDKEKATKIRKAEHEEYAAAHLDYSESIDALGRAIQVLKSRSADVPQSSSLLDVHKVAAMPHLPSKARQALTAFLQAGDTAVTGAPEANAYEFQSASVVGMLEELLNRFVEERGVLEKEEMNRKNGYEMLVQKITDDVGYATKSRSEKAALKGTRLEDAAEGKGELVATKEAKEADEKYLIDMRAECHQKSLDYENRQNLRAGELEAIQKAIDIISSGSVAGAGEKYLPSSLVEVQASGQPTSLAQLRSSSSTPSLASALQERVRAMLVQQAKATKSQLLYTVADRVSEDPLGKVKKMIKDLITRLMEEANEEADHHAWCEEELHTNGQTREQKSSEVDELTASIDELTALEAKLAEEIAALNDAVAEIKAAVAEATKARAEEKEKNKVTIADAKEAQIAVTQALSVLKDFYAQAATATSLAQQPQAPFSSDDAPVTFDKPYTGMQGAKGGVIGMLEVINSDFARLEADTSTAEGEAQREFEKFEADSDEDRKLKEKEARHKGYKKTRAVRDLNRSKKHLKNTQEELDAAMDYYEKLKPSCIGEAPSYADRVERRKEEILSLQEALKILSGEELG